MNFTHSDKVGGYTTFTFHLGVSATSLIFNKEWISASLNWRRTNWLFLNWIVFSNTPETISFSFPCSTISISPVVGSQDVTWPTKCGFFASTWPEPKAANPTIGSFFLIRFLIMQLCFWWIHTIKKLDQKTRLFSCKIAKIDYNIIIMIKNRYTKQHKKRRNGLDHSFVFFQSFPKRTKYTIWTCIACIGTAGLVIPFLPGRLLILTSVSIFAPARYVKYVWFHYRSLVFVQTITNYQNTIQHNFRTSPKVIVQSRKLQIKKRRH